MKFGWLKTRQTKFGAYVTLYILIVVGALGMINWLANRHNKSVDTTANRRFSLSDQTDKVVKGLNQDVKITYWDKTAEFQRARDLLDRYDALSNRLSVDYIDPYKKPQLARASNIRQEGTLVVQSGTRREEAKSVTEEEVTGALIRVLKGGARTVCAVQGSGEHQLDDAGRDGYSTVKQLIERDNYKTRAISLLEKAEVPSDCTVLLIAGPRFDYVPPAVDAIKKYVDGGGRMLVMLDPPLQLGRDRVAENAALAGLIASWGITLNKDLVLDTSGVGQIFGFNEAVPLVANYETHAIVREMRGVATGFPLARSLDVTGSAERLFSTTDNSFSTANMSSPQADASSGKKGPFTLGAAAFTGGGDKNKQGRVVVVGSSGWVANGMIPFQGNRDLFLNMVNWLSSDEELISIRPKDPENKPLMLSRAQMSLIFYTSVILLPLAVIAVGVGTWWKRR